MQDISEDTSDIQTQNDECENFVTIHLEAEAEGISNKSRDKCRVS